MKRILAFLVCLACAHTAPAQDNTSLQPTLKPSPATPESATSVQPLPNTSAKPDRQPQAQTSAAATPATTATASDTKETPSDSATDLASASTLPQVTPDTQVVSVQDTGPITNLWQRLRAGMALPDRDDALVHSSEQLYSRYPSHMSQTLERAKLYLFHIVEEVDKRHMPMEIALLPIVESSFNPGANSPSSASGIWQFIPSTGRLLGLTQNNWYDGRRDVVKATKAALDYLDRLHDMFGDWELALAAYNCGEGCIQRAVDRNRAQGLPTDFFSLSLPPETRSYVPRLLAVRNIIRNPAQFGITLNEIPNSPAFKKVTLNFPIEARTAARLAQMDMGDFLALNPGFQRRVIYSESQSSLLLPPEKVDVFKQNLDATEARDIRLHTFNAPKGALLSRIADRFDVTIKWLEDHNPLATKRGKLVKAQTLILPPRTQIASISPAQLAPPPAPEPKAKASHGKHETKLSSRDKKHEKPMRLAVKHGHQRIHTVRKGDTLYSVAKRYNVKVADLEALNGAMTKKLKPGIKLHIPASG